MNLCSTKWNEPDFKSKHIAEEIKATLAQCGMIIVDLGHTYLADRLSDQGLPIQSLLDHIHRSIELVEISVGSKLDDSSTDHVPIILSLTLKKLICIQP